MKKVFLLLALALFTQLLTAHTGKENLKLISGKVIDKETGEIIAGAKIQVKGTDTFCFTDLNGNYLLALNSLPDTEIQVDIIGYSSLTVKSTELEIDSELLMLPR